MIAGIVHVTNLTLLTPPGSDDKPSREPSETPQLMTATAGMDCVTNLTPPGGVTTL
jgi:hypothetical protein